MKHYIRTLACGAALLAAMAVVACGGKETMASKSAAAYDEAKKKGIPIEAGEHGGHSNEAEAATDHAAMRGMDQSQMPGMKHGTATSGTSDMAGMDHSVMAGMDHSQMPGMKRPETAASGSHDMAGMDHSAMPGMDHSKMPGMKKPDTAGTGAHDMAGMNPSSMAGMDHSKMPGMQHGSAAAGSHDMAGMDHSAMAGMPQSGTMAAMPGMRRGSQTAATMAIPPPTSNAVIAQTQPSATLRPDEFDAPAPTAIEEAAKGASGMSHSMETATPKAPAQPKPPPPEHHHHGSGEAS